MAKLTRQKESQMKPKTRGEATAHRQATVPDGLIDRAIEVIGDRNEAFRWLGTSVRALGYETPISLLATPDGEKAVLIALDRLEQGVY